MRIRKIRIRMPCGQVEEVDLGLHPSGKAIEEATKTLIRMVCAWDCSCGSKCASFFEWNYGREYPRARAP